MQYGFESIYPQSQTREYREAPRSGQYQSGQMNLKQTDDEMYMLKCVFSIMTSPGAVKTFRKRVFDSSAEHILPRKLKMISTFFGDKTWVPVRLPSTFPC